ncbi:unnamed protein product [Adineta steineri]|uniref:Uncharacterized protein n=2 Tax=Adineta steineri TaxID=433720 RepID=A0A818PVS5_9BILA|nr:unnamed protein product [Adineta steineri]
MSSILPSSNSYDDFNTWSPSIPEYSLQNEFSDDDILAIDLLDNQKPPQNDIVSIPSTPPPSPSNFVNYMDKYLRPVPQDCPLPDFSDVDKLVASLFGYEESPQDDLDKYLRPVSQYCQYDDVSNVDKLMTAVFRDKKRLQNSPDYHRISQNRFVPKEVDMEVMQEINQSQLEGGYANRVLIYDQGQSVQCPPVTDGLRFHQGGMNPGPSFNNNQEFNAFMGYEPSYEQNFLDNYDFGTAQIATLDDSNMQVQDESTCDFELTSSALKTANPIEISQNPQQSGSQRIDRNEWFIVSKVDGKKRPPLLHEFLRRLLDNQRYSHVAQYVDRRKGIFKFHQREEAANLWQHVKARNSDSKMTYDKLARGIRYYYSGGIIRRTAGRFTFRFGIILASIKRSPIEIADAIKNFNSKLNSIELIQHLIQYIPNETEIDAFNQLSIAKEKLSPADRLVYEILLIPYYKERLNTIKFKLIFADNCNLLNAQIRLVNEACTFLYHSSHIKELLEIILSVLNHLNSTPTHRILTLDDLSKVCDLKTPKTRIPIMNIVSQICNDRHSDIFDLKQNYNLISTASKIDLTIIKYEIEQMKQQSEQIQIWLNKFDDRIDIEKFLFDCQETLHEIYRNYQVTNDQFHKTISYFTKQTTTSVIFLSIFANLIHSLQV